MHSRYTNGRYLPDFDVEFDRAIVQHLKNENNELQNINEKFLLNEEKLKKENNELRSVNEKLLLNEEKLKKEIKGLSDLTSQKSKRVFTEKHYQITDKAIENINWI